MPWIACECQIQLSSWSSHNIQHSCLFQPAPWHTPWALSSKKAADRKLANQKMPRLSAGLCSWFSLFDPPTILQVWSHLPTFSDILCSAAASQALTAKNSRCQVLLEALGSWLMHLEASEYLRIDAPKNRFSLVLPHGAQAGLIFCVRKVWKEQNKSMGIWSKAKKRQKLPSFLVPQTGTSHCGCHGRISKALSRSTACQFPDVPWFEQVWPTVPLLNQTRHLCVGGVLCVSIS